MAETENVLVVVSTAYRALNVRRQLENRVPNTEFKVFSTDGPVMDCPYELGVDAETLRPKWLRAHSGAAKRLLDAAQASKRVVVIHGPTFQEAGEARLVVNLIGGTLPVSLVVVPDFNDVFAYVVGTKEAPPCAFDFDVFEAKEVQRRLLSIGRSEALQNLPGAKGVVRLPAWAPELLQRVAVPAVTTEPFWVIEGTGDGFVAESEEFASEAEAQVMLGKLSTAISVSKTETLRVVQPPKIPTFEAVAQRAANAGVLLVELHKSLQTLSDLGLVASAEGKLPVEVTNTARVLIEESCGPEYVSQALPVLSSGVVWYAIDVGKRPSEQSLSTALRTVYNILWSITVGAHSVPARVKDQILSYKDHGGRRPIISATGLIVEDDGWYRPSLVPTKQKPLSFDVALQKTEIVRRERQRGGFQEADLLSCPDIHGVIEALAYAKEQALVDVDLTGRLSLSPLGLQVQAWTQSMTDLPPVAVDSITAATYVETLRPLYEAYKRWVADAAAAALPNKCPGCSTKIKVAPQVMKLTKTTCKKCKASSTLTRKDDQWVLL